MCVSQVGESNEKFSGDEGVMGDAMEVEWFVEQTNNGLNMRAERSRYESADNSQH